MALIVERGSGTLTKHKEELCGDGIAFVETPDSVIAVLSDGLGSGVKANILSTMTVQIITTLLKEGIELEEVIKTLGQTLPRCKVRKLAYSTFSILQIYSSGQIHCIEFDNPPVFFIRQGQLQEVEKQSWQVADKEVMESRFQAEDGDTIVMVSDGVIHAGIGNFLNLGWTWKHVGAFLETLDREGREAEEIAQCLTNICNNYYNMEPGDDASIAVLKIRHKHTATVVVGPPSNPEDDGQVARLLKEEPGTKIICGGTTSRCIAREWNEELEVDLSTLNKEEPPMGRMAGVDLITEGIITLSAAVNLLRKLYAQEEEHRESMGKLIEENAHKGSGQLLQKLFLAHEIRFLVGRAINPAHQNPHLSVAFSYKLQMVKDIADLLEKAGKSVTIQYF